MIRKLIISVFIIGISLNHFTKEAYCKDIKISFDELVKNYYSTESPQYDFDKNNIVDIYDVSKAALDLGIIDIKDITRSYVTIVSSKEKSQYEKLGYKIILNKCFPITSKGLDLFEYVNAARGMAIEIIDGDNCFTVYNDKIYLTGQAPAIAKVKLVSNYGESDEFYIYGTSDRELHNYTYDLILSTANMN